MVKDIKYPDIYASEYVVKASSHIGFGRVLSKSAASRILKFITMAMHGDDEEVLEKLADTFLKYDPIIQLLEDDEEFVPPHDAVGFRILHLQGKKQAMWLQPKSDYVETNINCCEECKFISKPPQEGMSVWCHHPKVKGSIQIVNGSSEIHRACPIENIKTIEIRHIDGEYARNVDRYLKE